MVWRRRIRVTVALALAAGAAVVFAVRPASAEYGDVVISKQLKAGDQPPVIFPHWFHRIRYRCNVCHIDLGIRMGVRLNTITMQDITDGRYCGACHNDRIAWGSERCTLCHSGKPGLPPSIQGGSETKGPGRW